MIQIYKNYIPTQLIYDMNGIIYHQDLIISIIFIKMKI